MYIIANGTQNIEYVVGTDDFSTGKVYYTSTGNAYIKSQFKTLDEVCNKMGYNRFKNKAVVEGKGMLLSKLDTLNLSYNYSDN